MALPSLSNLKSMGERITRAQTKLANNNSKRHTIRVPSGVQLLPIKEDTYSFDVLAYKVTTPKHPMEIAPGESWFCSTYSAHGRVGPNEEDFSCLKAGRGLPCPICEEVKRLSRDGYSQNKGEITALRAKSRFLMYVCLHDKLSEGVFLVDYSSFGFGTPFLEQLALQADELGDFTHPVTGKTFRVRFASQAFETSEGGTAKFAKAVAFVPVAKKNKYPAELLKQIETLPDLDSLVVYDSYDVVQAALDGVAAPKPAADKEEAGEATPATTKPRKAAKKQPEPEPEDEPEPEAEQEDEPENPDNIDLTHPAEETSADEDEDDPWA